MTREQMSSILTEALRSSGTYAAWWDVSASAQSFGVDGEFNLEEFFRILELRWPQP